MCLRRITGSYKCPSCNFPMCNITCAEGDVHAMECKILTEADFEADVDDAGVVDDHYAAILPLRCISLSQSHPDHWRRVSMFLSHCSERRQTHPELWQYHQEHSVDFVR